MPPNARVPSYLSRFFALSSGYTKNNRAPNNGVLTYYLSVVIPLEVFYNKWHRVGRKVGKKQNLKASKEGNVREVF